MAQFASTLYPQTNPSNPVLLAYREIPDESRCMWSSGFIAAAGRATFLTWTDAQVVHARRVLVRMDRLERLVSSTG